MKKSLLCVVVVLCVGGFSFASVVGPDVVEYSNGSSVLLTGGTWNANLSSWANVTSQVYAMLGETNAGPGNADIQWRNDGGYYTSTNGAVIVGTKSTWEFGTVIYKFELGSGQLTGAGGTISAHTMFYGNPGAQGAQAWMGVCDVLETDLNRITNDTSWAKAQLLAPNSWVGDRDGVNPIWFRDFTLNIPQGVNSFYVAFSDIMQSDPSKITSGALGYDALTVNAVVVPEPLSIALFGVASLLLRRKFN